MRRPYRNFTAAAALGILMSIAAAHAQSGNDSKSRLMFDPSGLQGPNGRTAKPLTPPPATSGQSATPRPTAPAASRTATPQPAPVAQPAAAPKPSARAAASKPPRSAATRPASADDAANRAPPGTARSTPERPVPREQPAALGRLDLPGGSLGYESRTQMRTYDLGDGRRVPGYENIQRNDSSYFGLSLRMPTSSSGSSIFGRHGAE